MKPPSKAELTVVANRVAKAAGIPMKSRGPKGRKLMFDIARDILESAAKARSKEKQHS